VPIGTLAGLHLEAHAARRNGDIELTMRCKDVPYTSVDVGLDTLHDDSKAVGLVTRVENRINALDHRRDELCEEAQHLDSEIIRAQGRIGTEFAQAGELSAAKLRAAGIDARLAEAANQHRANTAGEVDEREYSPTADLTDPTERRDCCVSAELEQE
jgi:hypothetical protein